ncbi:MAG TPA: hypothetical protein VGW35_12670 [Methylomirabilota bacterium]|jgi:hypothetical protein|nr:hypothetical protein [Methylomirabilota bacterium]
MPRVADFRKAAFSASRVDGCGKDIGSRVYWKLYAIENVIRVIINSVLTTQINANWWTTAVDPDTQRQVQRFRATYAQQPWHGVPGNHDIYYTNLSDLGEIMRANSNLFLPIIPDIDQWVARIEQLRLPRNIVGHMNWPTATDRNRIDVLYADVQALATHLVGSGRLTMVIP